MKHPKAFTLIELIISSAISLAIVASAVLFSLSVLRAWNGIGASADRLEGGRYALLRMTEDIKGSLSIDPASSPNVLVLGRADGTVSYDLKNDSVRRTVNGTASYLTEQGMVRNLSFNYPSGGLVGISIVMRGAPEAFSTEALSRNM